MSLAFPIAKGCTSIRYEDAQGNVVRPDENGAVPEGTRAIHPYVYVLDSFDPVHGDDWLGLSFFGWPIVFAGVLAWKRKGRLVLATRILEPLLIAWSVFGVYSIATFLTSGMASGAYIAFVALGILCVSAIWEDTVAFRNWRRARSSRLPKPAAFET